MIFGLFGLIFVIGIITFASKTASTTSDNNTASSEQEIVSETPTQTNTPSPITLRDLNITRDFIISGIQKIAPDVKFSQGAAINGQDNYTAKEGQNIMQLIGPSDNLTEISSTAVLGDSLGDNFDALVFITGIANTINPEAKQWVIGALKDEIDTVNNGENSIDDSITISQRKYTLTVSKLNSAKLASLLIDPASNHILSTP